MASSIKINPELGAYLSGFASRNEPHKNIKDDLEANMLLLKMGSKRVLVISLDLLYVGQELRKALIDRLAATFSEDEVFLCATHTHFAPSTDPTKPHLGRYEPDYVEFLAGNLSEKILGLDSSNFESVTLESAKDIEFKGNISRRRKGWVLNQRVPTKTVLFAPNPDIDIDHRIKLLRIRDDSEKLTAILWNYACHPSAFPGILSVSAEYPGMVRRELRAQLGERIPVIFMQGFTGDVRPNLVEDKPAGNMGVKKRVSHFLNGPNFGKVTMEQWENWTNQISSLVVKQAINGPFTSMEGELKSARITFSAKEIGIDQDREISVHGIALGKSVIFGISTEPVNSYSVRLREVFFGWNVIPVGYIDDVFGYLPDTSMIGEGGYEVDGFMEPFGLTGSFNKATESIIVARFKEIRDRLIPPLQ